jgi:hypothetical protein
MRQEFIEYAFLTDAEREVIAFPSIDATVEELQIFWSAVDVAKAARGEQPESSAVPNPGALRGDIHLSSLEKEIK